MLALAATAGRRASWAAAFATRCSTPTQRPGPRHRDAGAARAGDGAARRGGAPGHADRAAARHRFAAVPGRRFEITTLRRDVACDGRHAEVEFTDDFDADAARRDFTINAMSCEPDGTLHDPMGGRADLAAGRVRFVGDARRRIAEDYLRILRFFRFQARFGRGAPDAEALSACAAMAAGVDRLSGERVRQELWLILRGPRPAATLALMRSAGVLARVVPGAVPLVHLERLAEPDPLLRLAALIRPSSAARVDALADRLRLSNHERERLRHWWRPPCRIRGRRAGAAAGDPSARATALRRPGAARAGGGRHRRRRGGRAAGAGGGLAGA